LLQSGFYAAHCINIFEHITAMHRAGTMLNRTVLRGRVPFSGARLSAQSRMHIVHVTPEGSTAGTPSKPNIADLAKMAQISISEQEAAEWAPKINSVLDWFGQLQSVDVKGVPPAIHAFSEGNRLRPDEPQHYAARAQLLAQAPQTENTYVRVPKTASGDGETAAAAPSSKAPTPSGSAAPAAEPSTAAATAVAPAAAASTAATGSAAAASGKAPSASSSGGAPTSTPAVTPAAAAGVPREAVHALDIRVGRIVSCERHPDAESLYVEKIDVGEAEPRTIVSGLVKFVPLEDMQNRMVVVICNLKPRNMRGVKSFGMLLAASDEPHVTVEPLVPPAGARAGERVWFGEDAQQPAAAEAKVVDKKKYWEAVQPLLRTNAACVATLALGGAGSEPLPMNTSAGAIRAPS
ncbi:hypothetical protein Agub_g11190, partial [Astrephomene gubernaculifera]